MSCCFDDREFSSSWLVMATWETQPWPGSIIRAWVPFFRSWAWLLQLRIFPRTKGSKATHLAVVNRSSGRPLHSAVTVSLRSVLMILIFLLLSISRVLLVGAALWSNASNHGDCSALNPSLLIPISTTFVNEPSHSTSRFSVYHNATSAVRGDILVQFSIPNNSYGCQLEFNFTGGFRNLASSSESNQVDIWTTDRTIQPDHDWSNAPDRAALFGTAVLCNGTSRLIIHPCESRPKLNFRICMAGDVDVGDVSFFQTRQSGIIVTRRC